MSTTPIPKLAQSDGLLPSPNAGDVCECGTITHCNDALPFMEEQEVEDMSAGTVNGTDSVVFYLNFDANFTGELR
ncbi:hypothetical protein FE257_003649 [Aspergillus nanangensis]|uniref:Uncharacterized protein n=1 Tax=Aspergillus nanangensis TaxID=2582783 RepID=A0AAD4CSJ0_ASPNN|nr:hypothetical protein FE257_003649 [Aspergillus nanangensis]